MDTIIQLAEQLGKAIRQSPQDATLRTARKLIASRLDLKGLHDEYQKQLEKIASIERSGKPIEVAEKRSLQQLHDKMVAAPEFKELVEAEMEYVDLLRKVNATLHAQLGQSEGE
jgi:cell fate (sporulation/competence/biofilm development) regulator YlbF (YheA/YmcA/DUF963 family)